MSVSSPAPYAAGDLSRLLFPGGPTPPVVNGTPDPSFFGYLKPSKGRPVSRKAPKGGGKFSQAHLHAKVKAKSQLAKEVRKKHEDKVKEDRERKAAEKEARSNSGRPKQVPVPKDDEEEDMGIDTDDSDIGDDLDEDAIEEFMKDIEADDRRASKEDASDSDNDGGDADEDDADADAGVDGDDNSPAARARLERVAKKEKRLAEDEEMEAPQQKKKDLRKQRADNLANDVRLPRTIFVGNVPVNLKPQKLIRWIETELGVDSSTSQSIIESTRYRSVAVSDPKLPKRVAIQKGMLHTDRDSLNAYVVFKEEKYVDQAIEKCHNKTIELDGKEWRLRIDRVTSSKEAKTPDDNSFTIFCGNLPFNINENDLYQHFDDCGTITSVRVVRDRVSQMGKGIAFIKFSDEQGMRNALANHNLKFRERTLRIMKAVENKKLHHTTPKEDGNKKDSNSKKKVGGGGGSDGGSKKEGYGGSQKVKEMNQAGVWKKPRHVPRTGTATAGSASSSQKKKSIGTKRSFEGERADPSSELKKQKFEDFKQREKKEKRKEAKKL